MISKEVLEEIVASVAIGGLIMVAALYVILCIGCLLKKSKYQMRPVVHKVLRVLNYGILPVVIIAYEMVAKMKSGDRHSELVIIANVVASKCLFDMALFTYEYLKDKEKSDEQLDD